MARDSREQNPQRVAPLRLLVAEDSIDSFTLFQVYVKAEGHHISRAMNGAEAVEMVKSEEYDLVIMDIDMPVMGGYMAIQAIREWETMNERPRLPIILLSAEDAIRQRKIGASVGCSGYLTKPVAKGQLLDALRYYARVPKAAA